MQLQQLTTLLKTSILHGDGQLTITGVQTDSRKVQPGDLFICLPGHTVDGHRFAPQAIASGAVALVVTQLLDVHVPQVVVKDTRLAMAIIADFFYGQPSRQMKLIGVTGTNGKTTTTYLIERIFADAAYRAGVIGTVERRFAGQTFPMSGTTPEALDLQQYLAQMIEADTNVCAMEVSSHALEQGRVKGCRFRTAIFTNLTQDHLDYHETMEKYAAAKALFFSRLGNEYALQEADRSYAVLNCDDAAYTLFAATTAAEVVTYGIDNVADVRASNIQIMAEGTSFHVQTWQGNIDITLQMAGKFNVYNALAAICAGLLENIPLPQIKRSLEAVPGVPGRVEAVRAGQNFAVIVDYAHTPDGLDNVLKAMKELATARIITVFGCGGDRDRTKRPMMGQIAAQYSDYVFVTSDNPRTEDPKTILTDIEAGLMAHNVDRSCYELEVDRHIAIKKAVEMASANDVVLIAGKGHETYQIIGKVVHEFDDREVAKQAIRGLVRD